MKALRIFLTLFAIAFVSDLAVRLFFAVRDWQRPRLEFVADEHLETIDGERYGKSTGQIALTAVPFLGYRLKAGQRSQLFNVNSSSFRGPELKTNPEVRILITGGSLAFGIGLPSDADTISATLAHELDPDVPGLEVVNAGVPGYHSGHELVFLAMNGRALAPTIVVSVVGWNDFFFSCKSSSKFMTDHAFEQISERLLDYGYFTSSWIAVRAGRSVLQIFFPTWVDIWRRYQWKKTAIFNNYEEASAYFIDTVLSEKLILDGLGTRYLVVLQADQRALAMLGGRTDQHSDCAQSYLDFLRRVYERLRAEEISVLPIGLDKDSLPLGDFVDAVHLNRHGTMLLSKRIADTIREQGWVRNRSATTP